MKLCSSILLLLVLVASSAWAQVVENGSGAASAFTNSATTLDLTTFTVDAGSNLCLVAMVHYELGVTNVALTWDQGGTNQAMTSRGSISFGGITEVFVLVAPTTGNLTLRATWTATAGFNMGAVAFSGADQSTCINTSDTVSDSGTGATSTLVVTSSSDGATVVGTQASAGVNSTTTQTEIYLQNQSAFGSAGSYGIGGSSNTHTWSIATTNWNALGVHIIAASAGGGANSSYYRQQLQRVLR